MTTSNHSLHTPEIDTTNNPAPLGPLSGDWTDDDGPVIDEQFEAMDLAPQEHGTSAKYPVLELPTTTRLLSRSFILSTPDGIAQPDPVQAFGADPNRKELVIRVRDNGIATAKLAVGSDKTDVYNGVSILPTGAVPVPEWRSTMHTGAVWLYYTNSAAGAITVDVWVTTV